MTNLKVGVLVILAMIVASFFGSFIGNSIGTGLRYFLTHSPNNTTTIVQLHSASGSLISQWEVSEAKNISRYGNGSIAFTDIRGAKVEVSGGTIILLTLPQAAKTKKSLAQDIDEMPAPSCSYSPVYDSGYDQYTSSYYDSDKLPTRVYATPYSKKK